MTAQLVKTCDEIACRVERILEEACQPDRGYKPDFGVGRWTTVQALTVPPLADRRTVEFQAIVNARLLRVDVSGADSDIQQAIADGLRGLAERVLALPVRVRTQTGVKHA